MNPESAQALAGAAVLSLLAGMLILSPHGSLFFYGLAAIFAAVPAIFGGGRLRVVSAVVLVVSLAAAAGVYPDYADYLERIK
ncbi:MAG: hypothetical protein HYY83_03820, partial [Deltaproteobacteria bacterium]|nr:hypothetical protein [Deltaproteobacteria bacterium]